MGSIVHRSVPANLKWLPNCSHAHALFQDRFKDVQVGSRWFSTLYILSPNFHNFNKHSLICSQPINLISMCREQRGTSIGSHKLQCGARIILQQNHNFFWLIDLMTQIANHGALPHMNLDSKLAAPKTFV